MTMPNTKPRSVDLGNALLTVKEVAELDNCSEKTVRRAIETGLLDALRVGPGGRLLRIERAAHAAYRARLQWGRMSTKV
jgi:excisionase family DNA binding protein